jgi:hypothetical protein
MPTGLMQTHKSRESWSRWRGTLRDISEIATFAQQLIAEGSNFEGELHITVEFPTVESTYLMTEAFEAGISTAELEDIRSITITANDGLSVGKQIAVAFDNHFPAVHLSVIGQTDDRTWVQGAAVRMKEALSRGHYLLIPVALPMVFLAWLVTGIAAGLGVGILYLVSDGEPSFPALLIAIGLAGILFSAGTFPLFNRFFPTLELLPEGADTRWARAWKKLRRYVWAVVLFFVTTAVAALIWRYLGPEGD